MTATGEPSAEDQAYFRVIEDTFIRLRGAPLLLSPADWQTARAWRRRGIPLDLVCRALERVFERRAERGQRRPIHSLRYCAPSVEQAWEEVSSLTAPGHRREPQPIDVAARLEALAAALPEDLAGWGLADRLRGLGGDTEEVEERLAALDGELMTRLEERLTPAKRRDIEERLDARIEALSSRLPAAELDATRARLRRQILRRATGLPVLSLFSPEAQRDEPSTSSG